LRAPPFRGGRGRGMGGGIYGHETELAGPAGRCAGRPPGSSLPGGRCDGATAFFAAAQL